MSDTKKSDAGGTLQKGDAGGTLRLKAPRNIVLRKTVEDGSIKQSFSHGRSKNVVVERRKKKLFRSQDASGVVEPVGDDTWMPPPARSSVSASVEKKPASSAPPSRPKHHILKPMSEDERRSYIQEQKRLVEEKAARLQQEKLEAARKKSVEEAAARKAAEEAAAQAMEARKAAEESALQEAAARKTAEASAVQETASQETATQGTTPREATPQGVTPQEAVPQGVTPQEAVAQGVTPQEAVAQERTPQEAAHRKSEEETQESDAAGGRPVPLRSDAGSSAEGIAGTAENKQVSPPEAKAREPEVSPPMQAHSPAQGAQEGERSSVEAVAQDAQVQDAQGGTPPPSPARGTEERPESVSDAAPIEKANAGSSPKSEGPVSEGRPERGAGRKTPPIVGGVTASSAASQAERKKMTKSQREEVARSKTEALVAKRLSQLEELRAQKRVMEEKAAAQGDEGQPRKTLKTRVKRKGKNAAATSSPNDPVAKVAPKRRGKAVRGRHGRQTEMAMAPPAPVVRDVVVPEVITVSELASRMAVKASEVIKLLFTQGMMVTINEVLDQDTAVLLIEELGHRPKIVSEAATIDAELAEADDLEEELTTRSPVVTVMGHVDHGKTSLLDAIRRTDVTSREFGGITQHIGAYQVTTKSNATITFIDTPGHAAFTSMRSRGAQMTDIVVLVVASDDGVMPQTIEAIRHSKEAGVPIVVAINKMDMPSANPDRIMQQLSEHNLVPEEWGGDTIYCKVSAKTGEGIPELEEMLLLQAEMLNLQVNVNKKARGAIVEAKLDKGRGSVATCLVQSGMLREGDIFVVGLEWGKIRGLVNDRGEAVKEAGPSTPIEIIGLSGVPEAGDELITVPDERRAREIAAYRQRTLKEKERAKTSPSNMDDIFSQIQDGELKEVKVVIKGDVRGSVEAVADALEKIKHDEIRVNVIHTGVGGINESDVMLSMAAGALVLGFNVRADAKARELAKREKIALSFYTVIYNLIDDITKAMEGKLNPKESEVELGHAEVREVFRITKVGNVAGCMVTDGHMTNKSRMRVFRDNVVIYDGMISALRRFKDDVKEVREGMECGISLDKYSDLKSGDIIEAYRVDEVRQTIG